VTPLQNALFQHELSRHVRADDEAQALEPARLRDDVADDPDDFQGDAREDQQCQ